MCHTAKTAIREEAGCRKNFFISLLFTIISAKHKIMHNTKKISASEIDIIEHRV
jgi:hypothetical protein